jgi:hypothetical protein
MKHLGSYEKVDAFIGTRSESSASPRGGLCSAASTTPELVRDTEFHLIGPTDLNLHLPPLLGTDIGGAQEILANYYHCSHFTDQKTEAQGVEMDLVWCSL